MEFKVGVIRPVECFREGWKLIKDQYWLILAITLVGLVISTLVPLGMALGAMFCGIYNCLLRKMDGERASFQHLKQGFKYFLPGFVATLILIVPNFIFAVILLSSAAYMLGAFYGSKPLDDSTMIALFTTIGIEAAVGALVVGSIHALLMFTYPLIIEYNLSGWTAFKVSAKAVWANLDSVIWLIVVEFVIGLIGFLMLGIGVYFTLPLMFAGVAVAYRKVFPAPSNL
jgi:uncharacterized membrane protein